MSSAKALDARRVTHSFFQSCHGKGSSDSEGAVIKSGLRAAEDKNNYFGDTIAAHTWALRAVQDSWQCQEGQPSSTVVDLEAAHLDNIGARGLDGSLITPAQVPEAGAPAPPGAAREPRARVQRARERLARERLARPRAAPQAPREQCR